MGERAISAVTARAEQTASQHGELLLFRGIARVMLQLTVVVCADLEGLVAAHDEADLLRLLVLEKADVSSAALLPLRRLSHKTEKLGAPTTMESEPSRQ